MAERTGVTRVETLGSLWMIDNDLRRYCRFPKHEAPRERPEWSDERAGRLRDSVWHDFAGSWEVDQYGRLVIQVYEERETGTPDPRWFCVFAPYARTL